MTNKCETCGHEIAATLPVPPKPETKEYAEFDFMEIRDFIDAHRPGGGDRLWQYACNYWDLGNDRYISADFENIYTECKETEADLKFISENVLKPYKESQKLFWVCW